MQLLELLIGQVQAFIFAVLATVYIASAAQAHAERKEAVLQNTGMENRVSEKSKEDSRDMNAVAIIGIVSIIIAGLTIAVGSIGPALAQGRAITQALAAMAQQPDEAATIARTLFVGLAMIESLAIYCLVVAMILIFANPFWNYVIAKAGG